jgi:hypothetical protein
MEREIKIAKEISEEIKASRWRLHNSAVRPWEGSQKCWNKWLIF